MHWRNKIPLWSYYSIFISRKILWNIRKNELCRIFYSTCRQKISIQKDFCHKRTEFHFSHCIKESWSFLLFYFQSKLLYFKSYVQCIWQESFRRSNPSVLKKSTRKSAIEKLKIYQTKLKNSATFSFSTYDSATKDSWTESLG